jgi:hypothetical protein
MRVLAFIESAFAQSFTKRFPAFRFPPRNPSKTKAEVKKKRKDRAQARAQKEGSF